MTEVTDYWYVMNEMTFGVIVQATGTFLKSVF